MAFCTTCGANLNGAFCTQCGTPVSVASTQPTALPPMPATPVAPPPMPAMAGAPPAFPPKRKTSPLVWILVIILGLFLLGGIAVVGTGMFLVHKVRQAGVDPDLWRRNPGLAAGKMIAAVNPNVEVVRVNEGSGTITLRDKRTGKETTLTFDDARNGRFHISTEDENGKRASVDFGGSASRLPSWVPLYPGTTPEVPFSGSDTNGESGSFTFTTSDPPSKIFDFYREKYRELGLQEGSTQTTTDEGGMMTGSDEGSKRSLTITVGQSNGQTTVSGLYSQKR